MRDFLKNNEQMLLIGILVLAVFFRFYGLNWDQNQHLHPDERFLTMVAQAIQWPKNTGEYFSTNNSPLNPHNQNFSFFVYGTFPLFFTKLLASVFNLNDYNQFTVFGRAISAMFDIGTLVLVYLIGMKLASKKVGLLAAFFYTISVLPIQLSHFFAVDTFLTFFLVATVWLLIEVCYPHSRGEVEIHSPRTRFALLAGLSFGLALASKLSAILLAPTLITIFLFLLMKNARRSMGWIITFFLFSFLTFRIAQPYAFSGSTVFDLTINPKFIANVKEFTSSAVPGSLFPPAVQWNHTAPIVFPLQNIIFWGFGIPLGMLCLVALLYVLVKIFFLKTVKKRFYLILLLIAIMSFFLYQSVQFGKPMRYFFPIYPFLAVVTAYAAVDLYKVISKKMRRSFLFFSLTFLFITLLIWPLAFMTIYTRPHARVTASEWMYRNILADARLSCEHWDDCLPLNLPGNLAGIYQGVEFPLYIPDLPEKWSVMEQKLQETDYIILSSNRLYGSIGQFAESYPRTVDYYQALFNGSLGFEKVLEVTSRPTIPLPFFSLCFTPPWANYGFISKEGQVCNTRGITIVDDYAEESFTVYDHPKVVIFKKNR